MGVFDLLGTSKKAKQKLEEGAALLENGKNQEALACFEEALKLDSKNADIWYARGNARAATGKREDAIRDFSEAIKLDHSHAKAFGTRGLMKVQLGRFAEAVNDFNEAIRLKPDMAMAYYNLGSARFKLGQYEESLSDYTQAIKLYPRHAGMWYALGKANAILKKNEEAVAAYNEAVKIDPKHYKAHFRRGTLKSGMGQQREALADFDKVISLAPKYAKAYFNRANTRAKLGMKEEAVQDFDEAIKLDPGNAMAYYNRGNGRFAMKLYKEAIYDYTHALKLDSTLVWAYYSRSTARMLVGEKDKGIKDLEVFVQMTENAIGGSSRIREDAIRFLESAKLATTAAELTMPSPQDTDEIEAIKEEETFKAVGQKPDDGIKEQKFEAIMFIDICKSTNMIDSFGELHYFQKVRAAIDKPLTDLKKRYGCQFEKSTGDGYMLTFNDCANAVNLAVSILHSLTEYNRGISDPAQAVDIRIGMDCGQVIVKEADNDRIGDAANVAKRIEGLSLDSFVELAPGVKERFVDKNRLFASAKVLTMLGDSPNMKHGEVGWAEMKGKVGVRYQIHEIFWQQSQAGAPAGASSPTSISSGSLVIKG